MEQWRRTIAGYRRHLRLLWLHRVRLSFPSQDEVELIRIMGGHCTVFVNAKHPQLHNSLAFVWSLGSALEAEQFRRLVRVGKCYVAFGNDIQRAIEIDGDRHVDILAVQSRDEYLTSRGWAVLHIEKRHLYSNPEAVQDRVLRFLNN